MSGVHPLRSFELRAWARAYLFHADIYTTVDAAFEPLWADAERDGLLAEYGEKVLMDIVDAACIQVAGMHVWAIE